MATSVNIKMYRIGELGDCFLLTFSYDSVRKHMLIDCGSFRNSHSSKARLAQIIADIKTKQLKGANLDVVVGTHQHNDHVSGFAHHEQAFKDIGIEQVWLSWLDNPRNRQAVRLGENHLQLRKSLLTVSKKLKTLSTTKSGRIARTPFAIKALDTKDLIDDLMGFHGAAPETPARGIQVLKKIGSKRADYLSPGDTRTIPGIPPDEIRVYVLGPPKEEGLLYRKDPRKGESYDHAFNAINAMTDHFMAALNNKTTSQDQEEEQFPFNKHYKKFLPKHRTFSKELLKIHELYNKEGWRIIDTDWLEQASRLALYMDAFTNNSSLVLAIEMVQTGKVLLFVGDAQIGNWLSWNDVKFKGNGTTADSLLTRTVFYKVGHHGSHNATLKEACEKMNGADLVAMIPVDKSDPNISKDNGWKMPAPGLYTRLKEKTEFRVLRMDDGFADQCNPKRSKKAKDSWGAVSQPKITPLFIEYSVS